MAGSDEVKQQQLINEALKERAAIIKSLSDTISDQSRVLREMSSALGGEQFKKMRDEAGGFADAIRNGSRAVEEFGTGGSLMSQKLGRHWLNLDKSMGKLPERVKRAAKEFPRLGIVGAAAADAIVEGLRGAFNILKSAGSVIGGVIKWFAQLGMALISLPIRILHFLAEDANKLAQLGVEIAQAWEEVRKQFGSLSKDVGGQVRQAFGNLRGTLAETGLSAWRVLGDMAERIRYLNELFTGMGATVHRFGQEMAKDIEYTVAFQKGMGIAAEDMKGFGTRAIAAGRGLNDLLNETASLTLQLGDMFGLPHKMLSRDVSKMMVDVKNFGSLTVKEMARSATYARLLGVEIEKLAGVFDRYDNFEDAVDGAARLSQSFGANVDVMKMMRAQTADERIEMLRDAMRRAGRDAETMKNQELKLLATTTGLDEATAKQVFSLKNQGKSLNEVKNAADKAGRKQLTQAETTAKLADSIERVVKFLDMQGGLWDQFLRGFMMGIRTTKEYRDLLMNTRALMWDMVAAGWKMAKLFMELPGVRDIFVGFNKAITNFRSLLKLSIKEIDDYLKFSADIDKKGLGGTKEGEEKRAAEAEKTFNKITERFRDFWESDAKDAVIEGIEEFAMYVSRTIAGPLLARAMSALTDVIVMLTEFITDPKAALAKAKASATDANTTAGKMLAPLVEAFTRSWPALRDAFKDLWEVVKPKLVEVASTVLKAVGGLIALRFASNMGAAMLGGSMPSIIKGFKSLFAKGAVEGAKAAAPTVAKAATSAFDMAGAPEMMKAFAKPGGAGPAGAFGRGITSVLGKVALPAAAIAAALAISHGIKKYGAAIEKELGPGSTVAAKTGAAAAGLVDMITFGMLPDDLLLTIGTRLGGIIKGAFEYLKKRFGASFSSAAEGLLDGAIEQFQGIGDVIMGIIDGDAARVGAGMRRWGDGMGKQLANAFKLALWDIPAAFDGLLASVGHEIGKFIAGEIFYWGQQMKRLTTAQFWRETRDELAAMWKGYDKSVSNASESTNTTNDSLKKMVSVINGLTMGVGIATSAVGGLINELEYLYDIQSGKKVQKLKGGGMDAAAAKIKERAGVQAALAARQASSLSGAVQLGSAALELLAGDDAAVKLSEINFAVQEGFSDISETLNLGWTDFSTETDKGITAFEALYDDVKYRALHQVEALWAALADGYVGVINAVRMGWYEIWTETYHGNQQFNSLMTNVKKSAVEQITELWKTLFSGFEDPQKITRLGLAFQKITQAIFEPLINMMKTVQDSLDKEKDELLYNRMGALQTGLVKLWEVKSPSHFMVRLGENIEKGGEIGWKGVDDMMDRVTTRVESKSEAMRSAMNDAAEAGTRVAELAARIKPTLTGLSGNGKLVVERPKELISINLNVQMDTDDVRTKLTGRSDASIVTKRSPMG